MRKVTASAVILTALTGCSQNGVPSNEWSFEVPTDDQAVFSETGSFSSSELFAEDSAFQAKASSLAAQASAAPSHGSVVMGPATEQPVTADATQPAASVSESLASADFSQLVTTATSSNASSFIRATARPDPIADVRSYLSRRSSPGLLTSRLPYSSDVYLPSSPPAAPLSALGTIPVSPTPQPAPVAAAVLPTGPAGVSISALPETSVALPSAPLSSPAPLTTAAATTTSEIPSLYDGVAVPQAAAPTPAPADVFSSITPLTTTPLTVVAAPELDEGLPVLQPSQPIDDSAALAEPGPAEPALTATATTRRTSIGTSILRDLQRNQSDTLAAEPSIRPSAAESLPAAEPAETVASAPSIFEQPTEQQDLDAPSIALLTEMPADTASASEGRPTLEDLVRSIPERKDSPLLVSFRSVDDLLEREAIKDQAVDVLQTQGEVEQEAANPSIHQLNYEADTHSSQADSPLLEGLSAGPDDVSLSTIYVPISEEISVDASAALIQAAIAALGNEVTTVPFSSSQPGPSALYETSVDSPEATRLEAEPSEQGSEIARLLRNQAMSAQRLSPAKVGEQNPDIVFDVLKAAVEAATEAPQRSQRAAIPAIDSLTQHSRRYRQRIVWP
ncbi:MAG: hypothetical protein AAFQ74_18855 [Cyanobacteria bacterium J06623_4]